MRPTKATFVRKARSQARAALSLRLSSTWNSSIVAIPGPTAAVEVRQYGSCCRKVSGVDLRHSGAGLASITSIGGVIARISPLLFPPLLAVAVTVVYYSSGAQEETFKPDFL